MDDKKLQPRLVVIEGKEKGKAIPVRSGTSIIGRSKADIIIEDPRISRSHIALHFDEKNGTLSFTDLKSLNGTLLNSQTAESGELHDGDKLQLGNTLLDCQLRPDAWEASISVSIRPPEPSAPPTPVQAAPEEVPAEEEVPEDDFTEEPSRIPSFRTLYAKISPRTRLMTWAVLLAGFLLWGLSTRSGGTRGSASWAKIEALEKAGKPDEAFALAQKLQKATTEDPQSQFKCGAYFEKQGQFESAIIAYNNAVHKTPAEPLAAVRLASLLLRAGKAEQAEEAMSLLDGFLKSGPQSKELFIEAAQLFIEHKELNHSPEKAIIMAKALEKEYAPESAIGYKLEAQVLLQEKRNDEAMAILVQGLTIAPQDEWLLENLAFAKLSLKDTKGAEDVIRRWLESNPQNAKAQLVMAYLRYNEKDLAGALPYSQSVLQIKQNEPEDPYYKEALFLTGQIYFAQGQRAEAGAFLRKACTLGFDPACKHEAVAQAGGESNGSERSTATPAERTPAEPPPAEAAEPLPQ